MQWIMTYGYTLDKPAKRNSILEKEYPLHTKVISRQWGNECKNDTNGEEAQK